MTNVWYFAYGSNMQRETFSGRRGIAPLRTVAARVVGWRLVFDKPPLIPMSQSFANLIPDAAAEVWGVLYEVTPEDYAHVEFSEAVPFGNYRRVEVDSHPLAGGAAPVQAYTLVSDRRAPEMRPSRRYRDLIVAGALQHGLPGRWVEFLRAVPAGEESEGDLTLRAGLDRVMRKEKPR
jgi:sulfite reductase (NADPH) flavoprotein alpha-component